MTLARFSIEDRLKGVWFFEETLLPTDTNIEVVLGMFFLSFDNSNVEFAELRKHTRRLYNVAEALPTISWVKLIHKKEFAKTALNENSETFIMHVLALGTTMIHPSRVSQIDAL